jgi:hypothetical protein
MHIILPTRPARYKCRVCQHVFYDGEERAFARHVRRCAQDYHVAQIPERAKLAFLKPWDPEWAQYLKTAYAQGKIKPSNEPVS